MAVMRPRREEETGAAWQPRRRTGSLRSPSMGSVLSLCLIAALVGPGLEARASESPISGELAVKLGEYRADIDSEFSGTEAPYSRVFGSGGSLMFELEYIYYLWREVGALGLGGALGYSSAGGYGLLANGTNSVDETELNLLPVRLNLSYRFDFLSREYSVPLVPYVTAGLDYYLWWINSAAGIATYRDPVTDEIQEGRGSTWGWHVAVGLQFLLDVLAPRMARTLDINTGVNNCYIFAEYLMADVSDFGSDTSFQLGDDAFSFGIAFEF